jgi:hypothetical protein
MNLLDFKVKKYWGAFVDLKVLKIEYKKNEIKRKKYFYLKYKKWKTRIEEIEVEELKRLIIW